MGWSSSSQFTFPSGILEVMAGSHWIQARQLNRLFSRLSRAELLGMAQGMAEESRRLGMAYIDEDGTERIIYLPVRPWLFTPYQQRVFYRICWALRTALDRLITLYVKVPEVRDLLPLEEEEKRWIWQCNGGGLKQPQLALTRLDATATFDHPNWQAEFAFLESNSVGIGGIHYIPAAAEVVDRVVVPRLIGLGLKWPLATQADLRHLVYRELLWFARKAGHRLRHLAFVENSDYEEGTSEFPHLVDFFNCHGIKAHHADPRELSLKNHMISLRGTPIDLIYRDSELRELIEMERHGHRLKAFREAFRAHRVISTLGGELDHKSCFEILSSPRFARLFSRAERHVLSRHIPWTRLVRQTRTEGPDGHVIDLIPFARRHKDQLVIKPNRAYGGTDVLIGCETSQRAWEARLDRALSRPRNDVIQGLTQIREDEFPVIDRAGHLRFDRFFCVSGFAVTHEGIAFLGRCAKRRVVNVAQQGGLIPVLMVR